jgi:hypothetical protein
MHINKLWTIALAAISMSSCEKNDKDIAYGNTTIFMPQATVSGGGNANYPVPSGKDSATYNFVNDPAAGKVNVILGVSRSGLPAYQSFSVGVSVNKDTINQLISKGVLGAGVLLLPDDVYTLPENVSVPAGQAGTTFFLSLDKNKLKTYAGQQLAIAVKLDKPTLYQLNPIISTTVVIINAGALPQ